MGSHHMHALANLKDKSITIYTQYLSLSFPEQKSFDDIVNIQLVGFGKTSPLH